MIRFLCCAFRLLEVDEETASASLTDAFEHLTGYAPDFGPNGDAVTGFHTTGQDHDERQVVVSRRANKAALRRAITLLQWRHRLVSISIVTRPATRKLPMHDDWMPEWVEMPYDLDGVSVWPTRGDATTRDVLVLEDAHRPGTFVSTTLRRTEDLDLALSLPNAQAAWSVIAADREQTTLRACWRSVARARLDQQNVKE
jgi:hypothetical protein